MRPGRDRSVWIDVSAAASHAKTFNWDYTMETEAGIAGRRLRYRSDRALGGSIKSILHAREQPLDYDICCSRLGNRA